MQSIYIKSILIVLMGLLRLIAPHSVVLTWSKMKTSNGLFRGILGF